MFEKPNGARVCWGPVHCSEHGYRVRTLSKCPKRTFCMRVGSTRQHTDVGPGLFFEVPDGDRSYGVPSGSLTRGYGFGLIVGEPRLGSFGLGFNQLGTSTYVRTGLFVGPLGWVFYRRGSDGVEIVTSGDSVCVYSDRTYSRFLTCIYKVTT